MELLAILSGLGAAAAWGAGDFAGGLASRRAAAVRVVLVSQSVGLVLLVALGRVLREPLPEPAGLLAGAAGGLAGGVGLLLLYLSLARGKMGIAAPLTAVASGGIPLAVGLASEGLPGAAQLAGFATALAAIWIIARPGTPSGGFRVGDVVLPLLAGMGFGTFLAIVGGIDPAKGFVWPLVAARVASLGLMSIVWVAGAVRAGRGINGERPPLPWGTAGLAGVGDTAGNACFVLAAQIGRLDTAAVLSALYPAVTVLLARVILGERLTPRQNAGVGLALAAVVLIAL